MGLRHLALIIVRKSRRTSVQYRFGSFFSSKRLWFVDTVLWLCPSLPTETLKWLSSLPILMQESFWWWQCSDRYVVSLFPHLHTPFHTFSPSIISFVVSVDVKHHVYLLLLYHSCCFCRLFLFAASELFLWLNPGLVLTPVLGAQRSNGASPCHHGWQQNDCCHWAWPPGWHHGHGLSSRCCLAGWINQKKRISVWKMSLKHNSKDLNCFWKLT